MKCGTWESPEAEQETLAAGELQEHLGGHIPSPPGSSATTRAATTAHGRGAMAYAGRITSLTPIGGVIAAGAPHPAVPNNTITAVHLDPSLNHIITALPPPSPQAMQISGFCKENG